MFFVEAPKESKKTKVDVVDMDEEIDVVNFSGKAGVKPVKVEEDPDATEYSSSFGDTLSGSECESKRDFSDMEVESRFAPVSGETAAVSDGFSSGFRKKKVTAHWRKFISPLMWRCHWLELRTKELLAQASKYDKELAAYNREKELQSKMVEVGNFVSKLVPFESRRSHQKELMRRRKRKRFEDKVDVSSYMSNHVVFSYYENKRTETDGLSVDNDFNDIDDGLKGNEDSEWLLGLKGSDSVVEQILLNIDSIQSRVAKLKSHLNKAMSRNAKEGSSPGNLVPVDPPASFAQSVSDSPRNNGDAGTNGIPGTPPFHLSEDVGMPESAVSSFGDAADSDILGSTFGLLSAANGSHQIGALSKFADEDVLIDNQVAEEEFQNYEKVSHATEKPPEVVKKECEVVKKEYEEHSDDESSAPKEIKLEPGVESEKPLQAILKACYSGKRRGRKPKKKRRGGAVTTPVSAAKSEELKITDSATSLNSLKSEKTKLVGCSSTFKKKRMKKISVSSTLWGERLKVGSNVSSWRSERIKKQRQLGKRK